MIIQYELTFEISTFWKQRSLSMWSSCYTELPQSQPIIPHHSITRGALSICIPTSCTPANSTTVDMLDDLSPLSELSDSDIEMEDVVDPPQAPSKLRPTVFSIETGFDSIHKQNRMVNFRRKTDEERYQDTERERQYAENAEIATSLQDLSSKVISFSVTTSLYLF